MVRTKIIATLGPASRTEAVIRQMVRAGLDVARINCSHTTVEERKLMLARIAEVNRKYRRRLRVLFDLEGPRIRVGRLAYRRPLAAVKGEVVYLVRSGRPGRGNSLPIDYEGDFSDLAAGETLYIDDGNIALKIVSAESDRVKTRVTVGGMIKEHKGVNIPGVRLDFPAYTAQDEGDIAYAAGAGADYVAQSFVRTASDIRRVAELVKAVRPSCRVIAKIENKEGIDNIDGIIAVSDGIMVARGDMGVSLPIRLIPIIQKVIIRKCNWARKPVITATQMLESMTEHLRPTRAEVTDVANAIIDGTDYVMLSGETAVGKHPVETVKMMNSVIKTTEEAILRRWVG